MATISVSNDDNYQITSIVGGNGNTPIITVSLGGKTAVDANDWLLAYLNTNLYCYITGTGTDLDGKSFNVEDLTGPTTFDINLRDTKYYNATSLTGNAKFSGPPIIARRRKKDYEVAFDFTDSSRLNNQIAALNPNENVSEIVGSMTYTGAIPYQKYYSSTAASNYMRIVRTSVSNQPMFTNDYTFFRIVMDLELKVTSQQPIFDNSQGQGAGGSNKNGVYARYTPSTGAVDVQYFSGNTSRLDESDNIQTGNNRILLDLSFYWNGSNSRVRIIANGQTVFTGNMLTAADHRVDPANISLNTYIGQAASGANHRFLGWYKNNTETF